ncbi:MAG: amidohydrolase family protein [Gammaproteobacteria bacterium]|nr:amidohydrolase family protein [Gammaproteobacteria bacterium]
MKPEAGGGREVIVAAEWFDGERRQTGPVSLVVAEGRLQTIAAGDQSVALAGAGAAVTRVPFLMPGLVDAHVHLFLDGDVTNGALRSAHLNRPFDELMATARDSARRALACGITLLRDAGDRHGINHRIRAEARGSRELARVRSAGTGLRRPQRYGAFIARDVADDAAIRAALAALAPDCDEIKLVLTGIIDFEAGAVTDQPQFDEAAAALIVALARTLGRRTLAHCSGAAGLAIAVAAGVDSIEHGFFMDRDTLARMRDQQIAWTPTFSPVHFQWAQPEASGWSATTIGHLRRILDDHAAHLLLADELGVPLLLGTDAGSMGVVHGTALREEMDRWLEAGVSLERVLTAATAAPRRHFGLPARLAPGAPFDALALPGSPFADRTVLGRPLRVWLAD